MISLQDFIKRHFDSGTVRFSAETHITPHGIVKFRLITNRLGVDDELEALVYNNSLKVIENDIGQ